MATELWTPGGSTMRETMRDAETLFAGDGAMRAHARQLDWFATPLGPPLQWSNTQRAVATLVVGSPFAEAVLWGPDQLLLFSDAFAARLDDPLAALGQPAAMAWPLRTDALASLASRMAGEESVTDIEQPPRIARHDAVRRRETVYASTSYIPVRDEGGAVVGIFATVLETTLSVQAATLDAGGSGRLASTRADEATRTAAPEMATRYAELETRVAERTAALARTTALLQQEVTARARAQAERNVLLRRLASAQETERRHLARELHDEVGQHLTALGLGLQALVDIAPPGSEIDRRVGALRELTDTLGRELHALAVQLRPRALDDFGLEVAIASYAHMWSRQHAREVNVHTRLGGERLGPVVESAIYRIVQEALTNVARHSSATRAAVVVERRDDHIYVTIDDDGGGFDTVTAEAAGGLGLLGIRERATLLDGTLEIESAPGTGTTLFVRIPLSPSMASDAAHRNADPEVTASRKDRNGPANARTNDA